MRRLIGGHHAALGALAAFLATAGVSSGQIPDAGGVIHACYNKTKGAVRLVPAGTVCKKKEQAISWNQAGPSGMNGANGTNGTNGATHVVMRQGAPVMVPFNDFNKVEASCLPGERATGGGVYNEDNVFFPKIVSSYPTPNPTTPPPTGDGQVPTGWRSWVANENTAGTIVVYGYVICAAP